MAGKGPAVHGGNFLFSLGGNELGNCTEFGGGTPKVEAMDEQGGPMALSSKAHSFLTYSDIKMKINAGQSKFFVEWANQFLASKPQAQTGMATACNVAFEAVAVQEFIGLWIKKLTFDELDASKKDAVGVSAEMIADNILYKKGDNKKVTPKTEAKTRMWNANSFRVEIGGLPCDYIMKCKLPSFTQEFDTLRTGIKRGYENIPTLIKVDGAVEVTMPISHGYEQWKDWCDSYMIQGKMDASAMVEGEVEFFAHDQKTSLGSIQLSGLSPTELTVADAKGGDSKVKTCTVKLSCTSAKIILTQAS